MRALARRPALGRLPSRLCQFLWATLLNAKTIGPPPCPAGPIALAPPCFHTHSRRLSWGGVQDKVLPWAGGCYLQTRPPNAGLAAERSHPDTRGEFPAMLPSVPELARISAFA
jgi:hypothetical protein